MAPISYLIESALFDPETRTIKSDAAVAPPTMFCVSIVIANVVAALMRAKRLSVEQITTASGILKNGSLKVIV